jgi:hypothetical protein
MSVTPQAPRYCQTLIACAFLLLAVPSRAAEPSPEDKAACVAAHVNAQEERQAGRLVSAVRALDACSTDACPPLVRNDCIAWAETWPSSVPSIIVVVRDVRDMEQSRARIVIDDAPSAASLDGRPIKLDPGPHRLKVTLEDGTVLEKTIVLAEGEKARKVELAPPAPARASFPSASVWVPLVSVASVGTMLFATLAGIGKARQDELDRCAPDCQADDVAEMRRLYVAADVSLGVGAAGAAALALYFGIGAAMLPNDGATAKVAVVPAPGGAIAVARFAF